MDIISLVNLINANECINNQSLGSLWPEFSRQIRECLGDNPNTDRILSLGSRISQIFSTGGKISDFGSKSQSDSSVSGNAWSRLINWYLNSIFIGTRCWATTDSTYIPQSLKEALAIRINGNKLSNSKEIVVIGYSGGNNQNVSIPSDCSNIDMEMTYKESIRQFIDSIQLSEIKVVLLSAKTNCSDMIAIPLFWNFCYKGNLISNEFEIMVGNREYNPERLIGNKIFYSVVTLPSGQEERIKAGQVPGKAQLLKLQLLDGGFYWGRPKSSQIKSFSSFPVDNFSSETSLFARALANQFDAIDDIRSPFRKMWIKD